MAFSGGMLFRGQDGCIRDLAELRGTYRLIPWTETAIGVIKDICIGLELSRVVFMMDEPVSNSGRLKSKIYDTDWSMPVDVLILSNPDEELKKHSCVVTSDSIILDNCGSWFNMTEYALKSLPKIKESPRFVNLNAV